ncbi:hypothetical protein KY290_028582 [Solanum tuberosum]|uniref:F-box associated domain-containing protein n=1 Tax=Solanum tuberosum TaxID=4113 RepID=A0ABQ7ULF9_SOLTU|nr:hypothetical protein KY284_027567 [Solanum tuberosum]KAH0749350.1 hypothetical protein KY290_028582 [Solanum tuberosum]
MVLCIGWLPKAYGFEGILAMMVSVDDGSRDTEIWTLVNKSSGLRPFSWTKKFIIEPFSKEAIPLGMWNADELFVKVLKTHALKQVYFNYDLVTKEMNYFHVPKEQDLARFMMCGCYFENLELEDKFGQRY